MFEFILYMAFQELQWHVVNEVDFDDAGADILEIVYASRTLILDGIEWYINSLYTLITIMKCFAF